MLQIFFKDIFNLGAIFGRAKVNFTLVCFVSMKLQKPVEALTAVRQDFWRTIISRNAARRGVTRGERLPYVCKVYVPIIP